MNHNHIKYIAIAWGVVFLVVLGLHIVQSGQNVQHTINTSYYSNCNLNKVHTTDDTWADVFETWETQCDCEITIDGKTQTTRIADVQKWEYRIPQEHIPFLEEPDCAAHCKIVCGEWFETVKPQDK